MPDIQNIWWDTIHAKNSTWTVMCFVMYTTKHLCSIYREFFILFGINLEILTLWILTGSWVSLKINVQRKRNWKKSGLYFGPDFYPLKILCIGMWKMNQREALEHYGWSINTDPDWTEAKQKLRRIRNQNLSREKRLRNGGKRIYKRKKTTKRSPSSMPESGTAIWYSVGTIRTGNSTTN